MGDRHSALRTDLEAVSSASIVVGTQGSTLSELLGARAHAQLYLVPTTHEDEDAPASSSDILHRRDELVKRKHSVCDHVSPLWPRPVLSAAPVSYTHLTLPTICSV